MMICKEDWFLHIFVFKSINTRTIIINSIILKSEGVLKFIYTNKHVPLPMITDTEDPSEKTTLFSEINQIII